MQAMQPTDWERLTDAAEQDFPRPAELVIERSAGVPPACTPVDIASLVPLMSLVEPRFIGRAAGVTAAVARSERRDRGIPRAVVTAAEALPEFGTAKRWTTAEIRLLGRATDPAVAAVIGRKPGSVRWKRRALKIASYIPATFEPTPEQIEVLRSERSRRSVAEELGIGSATVSRWRAADRRTSDRREAGGEEA